MKDLISVYNLTNSSKIVWHRVKPKFEDNDLLEIKFKFSANTMPPIDSGAPTS